ncbi:hypothetical protein ACO0RG_003336 [Hanseniaspora osmophila]
MSNNVEPGTEPSEIDVLINPFIEKLKTRKIQGSYEISMQTLQLLKRFIGAVRFSSHEELFTKLSNLGYKLEKAQPREFGSGNMIRRLLYVLKEELLTANIQHGFSNNPGAIGQTGTLMQHQNNSAMYDSNKEHKNEPMISSMFSLLQTPHPSELTSFKNGTLRASTPITTAANANHTAFAIGTSATVPLDEELSANAAAQLPAAFVASTTSGAAEDPAASGHHADARSKKPSKFFDIRATLINAIKDLMDEIKNIDEGIFSIAIDLIHDREILLTPTPDSKTVLKFLLKAKEEGYGKVRNFTVLVTEGFPNNVQNAQDFAWKLSSHGIDTVIIPDSMVFSVMSRVGKVILGCKQVFSNGACIVSNTGVTSCCECAKEFKTPVFAVAGLYKLSPLSPFNITDYIEVGGSNTGKLLPSGNSNSTDKTDYTRLTMINPMDDYVQPENIDIVITNIGGFAPSFMYRVVLDNYKVEDVNFKPSV